MATSLLASAASRARRPATAPRAGGMSRLVPLTNKAATTMPAGKPATLDCVPAAVRLIPPDASWATRVGPVRRKEPTMQRRTFLAAALAAWALALPGRAADDKPIRVLIITGDHGHNWKETT